MLTLQAIDRVGETIYLIEARSGMLRNEDKVARLVSNLFKQQGSKVVARFRQRYKLTESISSDVEFITKELESGSTYLEAIEKLVKQTYMLSVESAIGKFSLDLAFSLKHPKALEYFKDYGLKLLQELNETTKDSIKVLLTNGLDNGHSPDKIAKAIKDQFASYAELPKRGPKHIRSRAQLVAVTELGNAYQQGNIDTVRAAMSTGLQFEKKWSTTGDDRVSDGCKENGKQGWIDIDTDFSSGHDRPLRFPGCRCALQMRRKRND